MSSFGIFLLAALLEITGCFAFWQWQRAEKSVLWLLPGTAALIAFAWLLSRAESAFAGRAFAAYGGVYIISALLWLWLIEGKRPDSWDIGGSAVCLCGALLILFAPRG